MKFDIYNLAKANEEYRKILYTDKYFQYVVMNLKADQDIPTEKHKGTQNIQVVSGFAIVKVHNKVINLLAGQSVIIPPETYHYVKNGSHELELKLISIYTPPEHH